MSSNASELPDGLAPDDQLFHVCGSYFVAEGTVMQDYYERSLATMAKTAPEFRNMQFVKVGKVRIYHTDCETGLLCASGT